jgi:hypothetical protein
MRILLILRRGAEAEDTARHRAKVKNCASVATERINARGLSEVAALGAASAKQKWLFVSRITRRDKPARKWRRNKAKERYSGKIPRAAFICKLFFIPTSENRHNICE